jgi:hypothetical protein
MRTRPYPELIADLNADPRHQFIVSGRELELKLSSTNAETFLTTLMLYAPMTLVLTPEERGYKHVMSPIPVSDSLPNDTETLRLRALVESTGSRGFHFLPERVVSQVDDYGESETWPGTYDHEEFSFEKTYSNRLGLEFSLSDPAILSHALRPRISDRLCCRPSDIGIIKAWLPTLCNLPAQWLAKLQADEEASFARFHGALRRFLGKLPNDLTSEQRIKEMFEEVDHEVRAYEAKMLEISRKQSLRRFEVVVGVTAMALCTAMPSDVAKVVMAAIGTYQVRDFVKHLLQPGVERLQLKSGDFYVPWLCARKSNDS